jgi:hypothetical protein
MYALLFLLSMSNGGLFKSDLDHLFHYIRDFMLLENFLKANEITYTFWRALGRNEGQDLYRLSNASHTLQLTDEISDNNCWISFDDVDTQLHRFQRFGYPCQ